MKKVPVGILLSGRGSNFLAIHRAIEAGKIPADIVLVLSNLPEAPGLAKAKALGLETAAIPHKGLRRSRHDEMLVEALREAGAAWVCLAGYMRLLSPFFVDAFANRIVNIHPSLLPAFPGLNAQQQAWDYGVRISGCTVHLVDHQMDTGPIVSQAAIDVEDTDSPEDLSKKILAEEHRIYPQALRRLLEESWEIRGRRVLFSDSFARGVDSG